MVLVQILQQAWPFVGQYLEKLLVGSIAPAIRASSVHLQTLSFTKVNIGDKVRAGSDVKTTFVPCYCAEITRMAVSAQMFTFVWKCRTGVTAAVISGCSFLLQSCLLCLKQLLCSQAVKVLGVKAHTEQDKRQVMLDLHVR